MVETPLPSHLNFILSTDLLENVDLDTVVVELVDTEKVTVSFEIVGSLLGLLGNIVLKGREDGSVEHVVLDESSNSLLVEYVELFAHGSVFAIGDDENKKRISFNLIYWWSSRCRLWLFIKAKSSMKIASLLLQPPHNLFSCRSRRSENESCGNSTLHAVLLCLGRAIFQLENHNNQGMLLLLLRR